MTTSLWKPSPKASGSGPTSARRRASGTFEAVRSSREKSAFDLCDRKCSLIGWRKTHECAAWAAPPATTRRNLLSASSDESREYSNTLEAALDGPKRSKSLWYEIQLCVVRTSRAAADAKIARCAAAPRLESHHPIACGGVFSVSSFSPLQFGMCVSCADIMCGESHVEIHRIRSTCEVTKPTSSGERAVGGPSGRGMEVAATVHVLFVLSIILVPSSYINCSTTIDVCGTPASRVRTHPLRAHARWPSPCDWRAGARTRPIAGSVGSLQEQCCARRRASSRSRRSSSRGVRQRAREPLLRAHGRCPPRWARQWIHQPPRRRPPPSLHRLLARRQQCVERWSERAAREPPTAP